MYVKFHLLTKAEEVFESLSGRNIVTWNVLISGYVECDQSDRALKCLEQMHLEGINPDAITFVCCLKACACVGDINKGEEIRGIVDRQGLPQSNIDIGNALIFMYVKCGSLAKAEEAFDLLTVRNEASWNTLISGYVENGKFKKALDCLQRMEDAGSLPDSVTFILSLKICGVMGEIDKGKGIHLFIEKQGMHTYSNSVSNSLISMYARSGLLTKAHEIFDRLELQDVISWNTLISAYTELGLYEEAIKIFSKMQLAGNIPDFFTYISVLKACGKTGAIDKGHELHDAIEKIDIQEGMVVVGSTLVEMYANMGFLRKAQRVFDKLCIRGVVSWTILLSGYAQLGEFKGVFELFRNMLDEGTKPDSVTFVVILNTCTRVGMPNRSESYFEMMCKDYAIVPMVEHHACVIDALGRAGHLVDAVFMVHKLSQCPNLVVWHSLLGACKQSGDLETGKKVFERAIQFDKYDARSYVLWSQIRAKL